MQALDNISNYDRGWLIGLIEGEGSFIIEIGVNRKTKYGVQITPSFKINLVAEDKPALDFVRDLMNLGRVRVQSNEYIRKKGKKDADIAEFRCFALKDLLKVKNFLKGLTWRSKKKQDFDLWCQALELIRIKAHLKPEGIIEICKIRDQMNGGLENKQKNYRTAKTIESYLRSNSGWKPSQTLI